MVEWNSTTFNQTLLNDTDLCTLSTCPLDLAEVDYIPSLPGNAFYLALFALALAFQCGLGIYYKTWTYLIAMVFGLAGEIVGYIGRIQMHYNPFPESSFLMYLVPLTIAPAFFTAAIYLCFSRIVLVYGREISYFRPKTYTYLFIAGDVIALLLQAAGGGITATATGSLQQTGINIMIAGLAWQVVSLAIFMSLCIDFAVRVRRVQYSGMLDVFNPQYDALRASTRFNGLLVSLLVAWVTIFVRSIFRCAELSGGFSGSLANDQTTFMILEGAMISIAVIAMTVSHPGLVWKIEWRDLSREMKVNNGNRTRKEGARLMSNSVSSVEMALRSNERTFV